MWGRQEDFVPPHQETSTERQQRMQHQHFDADAAQSENWAEMGGDAAIYSPSEMEADVSRAVTPSPP